MIIFNTTEVIPKNTPKYIQDKLGQTYRVHRAFTLNTTVEADSFKRSKMFDINNKDKRYVRSRNVVFEYHIEK